MNWGKLFLCHFCLLVIIYYLNLISVTFSPLKADLPLFVDPNTMLIFPIPGQFFLMIGRRHK